jgi:hypothetical protein
VVSAAGLLVIALRMEASRRGGDTEPPLSGPWLPPGHTNVSTAPVAYDGRSVFVGGKRVPIICGAIHYPRSDPSEWRSLLQSAKDGGLNCVETLVFWNLHEPSYRAYDFSTGRKDIGLFLQTAEEVGLVVVLRLGPYICGEWDYGGIPGWLLDRKKFPEGVAFRTRDKVGADDDAELAKPGEEEADETDTKEGWN